VLALGTVLLLNYSEMTPPEVIGTDLIFGLVLAVSAEHFIGSLARLTVLSWASSWPAECLGALCLDARWRATFLRES